MNFYINQSIHINVLRVGGVSNSSVLQIGSAGIIKSLAKLYNTGGFVAPAPETEAPGQAISGPINENSEGEEGVLVPLAPPSPS